MPKQYNKTKLGVSDEEIKKLILEGYVDTKVVRQCSNTSGLIRVPAKFIGKTFRIIFIPEEDTIDLNLK